jgi:hypothetical protein
MTTLTELNALRTAANMKPLKVWKASKAALVQAIAKLQSSSTTEQQLKASADVEHGKKIKKVTTEAVEAMKEITKNSEAKTIAEIAFELKINPKVARAKLRRRDDIPRLPGKQWSFASKDVATVKSILTGDNRKKS